MALILNLDTTTKVCSAALSLDGRTIALKESHDDNYTHAEKLHVFIAELMRSEAIRLADLDAIAVAEGPGSYTGLRIGVSAAKGLCYALGKPLIAVNPLRAMALEVIHRGGIAEDALICPMIDARRQEVFMATFNHQGQQIKPVSAEIIDDRYFESETGKTICLCGDGAAKFKPWFEHVPNIIFTGIEASASWIGRVAETSFTGLQFADVAYFEPLYGKEFQTTVPREKPRLS